MKVQMPTSQTRCCIVIASEERSERLHENLRPYALTSQQSAVVKMGFLRQTAQRARKLASPANVLVSAREEERSVWTGPLWFTRPANRFISDRGVPMAFSTVAAVLSVAVRLPHCLVTVLPSDFWVAKESLFMESIEKVLASLQRAPGTVATLGMSDPYPGNDEDYLVVGPESCQTGAVIQARAHRPAPSIAKQLVKEGALVASGILLGQAQAFAERVRKYWPTLALELTDNVDANSLSTEERRLSVDAYRHISRSAMSSIRMSPPAFPMRAYRVQGSGWCSRKPFPVAPTKPATAKTTVF